MSRAKRLRKITKEELNKILEEHILWLHLNGEQGQRADLSYTDLSGLELIEINLKKADLTGSNLQWVILKKANLNYVNLEGVNLSNALLEDVKLSFSNLKKVNMKSTYGVDIKMDFADLEDADLSYSILRYASLYSSDLKDAVLIDACLPYIDLHKANLINTDIRGANLYGACLYKANLTNIKHDSTTKYFSLACPEKGEFIGYKQMEFKQEGESFPVVIKLLIPADAKRSSATTSKCRCNKAKVLSITDLDGNDIGITEIFNEDEDIFTYRVGQTIEVEYFDDDRFCTFADGIYFYVNKKDMIEDWME